MGDELPMPREDDITRVTELIEEHDITSVRVSLGDLHGIARGRTVPSDAFLDAVASGGTYFTNFVLAVDSACGIAPISAIDLTNGFPNWRLIPDLTTFTPLPWAPGQARVLADLYDPDGHPAPMPRALLKRQLAQAEANGVTVDSALEYEFTVFQRDQSGNTIPFDTTLQYGSELVHARAEPIWQPIFTAIAGMGIAVEAFSHEYSPAQCEISLAHQRGMRAADDAFQFKTSVKEVMGRHGYLATFMTKPLNDANANGCHVHISLLDRDGHNLLVDPDAESGVSPLFWHFLAGQLAHAPAMVALTSPTLNCYKRLVPNRFAPITVNWGWEDRTVLLRIPMQRGSGTHIENRLPSAASNPYLALAAVLAAGLDGIRTQKPMPASDSAPPLPRTLPDALETLRADETLVEAFGEQFISDYATIKRMEVDRANAYVTDWDRNEYMEMF